MRQNWSLFYSSLFLFLLQGAASLDFNVTALSAENGSSILQCWQMANPFDVSDEPGIAGTATLKLGDTTGLTYVVVPAGFDGGLHTAPSAQWVAFTSGIAYITLPDDSSTAALVTGGELGIIFAADTADVSKEGHRTQYPGVTETTALELPTRDGKIPDHRVLHNGPCGNSEMNGVREPVGPTVEGQVNNLFPFQLV